MLEHNLEHEGEHLPMRTHGTLVKWNDDRGFGFIEPAAGSVQIFVHISAFPHDGVRPRVGELVSYEVDLRKDGKSRATRIMRPGTAHRPRRAPSMTTGRRLQRPLVGTGGVLLLAAIAAYVYFSGPHVVPVAPDQPAAMVAPPATPAELFSCDGRTMCSQMTSCAEARFFLATCPGTKMDGNHDGVPCQSQWCGATYDE